MKRKRSYTNNTPNKYYITETHYLTQQLINELKPKIIQQLKQELKPKIIQQLREELKPKIIEQLKQEERHIHYSYYS